MKSSHILLCLLIGFITISQCGALPDLKLFDNGLTPGLRLATNEPCRIACEVADGKGLTGGKAITAYTTDYAKEGDSCYIRFNASRGSIDGYTELDFFAKAAPIGYDNGFAGILLKDEYETQGPYANIPKIYTRFRFPILNTYDDISLNKLISPFYLELFLVKGEAIYADKVILRSRPFFDIFTDATEYGREKIYSWGDSKCAIKTIGPQAPDGEDVLSVPSGTWGCGLFYSDPYIDLSYFKQIQFQLKSKVDVLIEIEAGGAKKAITVKKTNNYWKKITLDLYQFGLDLKNTYGPFLITKVGDASSEVQVDEIRYIPPAY